MALPRPTPAPAPLEPQRSPRPLSRARRIGFTIAALAFPWVLLVLLELALRAGGYGESWPLFVGVPDHPAYRVANQAVGKRWFGDAPFVPTPPLDFFPAVKGPTTYRIVFQGESSAQGFPYDHGGAPSRMLEQRLQRTFPGRDIEVINTALTAVSSYTLLDQADEIIAQQPDAVLIYTGHNEYYGALGAASTRAIGGSPRLVRAWLALRRLRTVQLLDRAIGAVRRTAGGEAADVAAADAPRTVMQLMAGRQLVPLGSPLYDRGLAQFRANMTALLARYRAHGIPVYVGTLASNERDQPPLVSAFRPGTDTVAWRARAREATDAMAHGDTAAAARALDAALRLDSTAADGWYALARLADARGDSSRAHALYRAAKERDALRFRAPEAMNAIIREVAAREGATVVETERALERASPGGTVGQSLILEHLHPNVDGYFLIADAFFEALRARGAIGDWSRAPSASEARAAIPVTVVDSLVGSYRTDRLKSGWPFQPRGTTVTPVVDTLHPTNLAERLAQGVVLQRIPWPAAMDTLREAYVRQGDSARAIRVAMAMAQEYRYSAQPWMDAARIAVAGHRYDEALGFVVEAARREETPRTAQLAGLLFLRRGDWASGVRYLERAAQLAPRDQRITMPLEAARALPALEAARARTPRDTTVLYALAVRYALTQQYGRAREALDALLGVAPGNATARALERQLPPDDGGRGAAAPGSR